jgi:hypothetical protein
MFWNQQLADYLIFFLLSTDASAWKHAMREDKGEAERIGAQEFFFLSSQLFCCFW